MATESDIFHILEIERESISPPWTHGTLLCEIYREDSFFALAATDGSEAATRNFESVSRSSELCEAHGELGDSCQERRSADDDCTFPLLGSGAATHSSELCETHGELGDSCQERRSADEDCTFPLLGFMILRRMGDDGELLQIAVKKSARRLGIGDILMDAADGYAEENTLNSVFLEVRKSNDAAIALYRKHGFKLVRVRKNYYTEPAEDAEVMVKVYLPH